MQKQILIGFTLTLIIVVFIAAYWMTESERQDAAYERQHTEATERGAELYTSYCAACHGSNGEGEIGPALKNSPLDENALEKIIARGIPGTTMPAMSKEDGGILKMEQMKDIVTFIKNWDSPLTMEGEESKDTSTSQTPPSATTATSTEKGQAIFEIKCAGCHSIGGGRKAGPDLKGVTELRDWEWLIRFIVNPDKVIAEGDSIAQQLIQEYGVIMPDMGLSEEEAKDVLSYIMAQPEND